MLSVQLYRIALIVLVFSASNVWHRDLRAEPPSNSTSLLQLKRSCLMNPLELRRSIASQSLAILDLRGTRETFPQSSQQVSPQMAPTMTHLRDSPVLLIAEPGAYSKLFPLCQTLHDAGFKQVSVLPGGIHDWMRAGGPVSGNITNRQHIAPRISARALITEAHYQPWKLIVVSDHQAHTWEEISTPSLNVEWPWLHASPPSEREAIDSLVKLLRSRIRELRLQGEDMPLAITGAFENPSRYRQHLLTGALEKLTESFLVFYLEDGLNSLHAAEQLNQRMQAQAAARNAVFQCRKR